MPKLSVAQIQFIDTYLRNSGVEYADIRYEMTDHVAAALERKKGDFYDNFRQYMLVHKKGLLESNRQFSKIACKNAFRLFAKKILSLKCLFIVSALFLISYLSRAYYDTANVVEVLRTTYTLCFIALCIYYIYTNIFNRKSIYSMLDKLIGTTAAAIYFFVLPAKIDRLILNEGLLLLYYSVVAGLAVMFLITYKELKEKYKMQFNG